MRLPKGPSLVLMVCMFFTGACGIVYEYVLSTVATYILGNSIEQFSVIIALMMLMMGVAGMVQSRINDEHLVEKFIAAEAALAILGAAGPLATYAGYCLIPDHFLLIQYGFIVAIGFLIGLEFPLASRINERYAKNLSRNLAGTIGLDYIGSFIGALVWAFWLIKALPLVTIGVVVGCLNLVVAAITFLYFSKQGIVKKPKWVLGLFALALVVSGLGFTKGQAWADGLEQHLYDDPIVFAETTKYQRLVITHDRKLDDYRLYINGNSQFSSTDEAIYHEQLVHPAMAVAPSHRRVLVLGGGDGLALREILKYPDVEQVVLVDLDPDMIKLAKENPILRKLNKDSFHDARVTSTLPQGVDVSQETRPVRQEVGDLKVKGRPVTENVAYVHIYTLDADRFLSTTRGEWDLIFVDLPDPNSVELAKLYSREFYAKARRMLAHEGVMVVQSTSPFHAKESFLCMLRTIGAAGFQTVPYHDNVPSFGDWGWIMAGRQLSRDLFRERIAPLETFPVPTRYLTRDVSLASLAFGKGQLASRSKEISTFMQPTILKFYVDEGWQIE